MFVPVANEKFMNILSAPLPKQPGTHLDWGNLPGASLSLALSNAIRDNKQSMVIITPDTLIANQLGDELAFFLNQDHVLITHFPDWETLPYDHFSPHQDIISGRLSTLFKLPTQEHAVII